MKNFKGKQELGGIAALATLSLLLFPFFASASVDFDSISLDPLSQGLIAYWPFDGDTTNWKTDTTADIVGGNTGTFASMSTTTSPVIGKIGEALNFSGSGSAITTSLTTNRNSSGSVAFWVKRSSFAAGGYFNSAGSGSGTLFIRGDSTGQDINAGAHTQGAIDAASAITKLNTWYYVVVTWSGSSGIVYVNGVAKATGSFTVTPSLSNAQMGTDDTGNFTGVMDDVRIYNYALSAQEIGLLYSLGEVKAGNTPQTNTSAFNFGLSAGLAAYWPLDGDTTSWTTDKTADVSGGNTGTMVGMSTTTSPTIGKIGQALKFNGSSNYIATAYTVPAQNSSTSFTWSTWLKLAAGNPSNVVILGNRGGGGATWIKLTPTAFEYSGGIITHTIPTGAWVQVTIVKNGTNFTYYQNGTVIGTATNSGSTSAYTFYMGEDPGYTGDGDLTGTLDDVRIYSRALSYQEVQDLYNEGRVAIGNSPTPTSATSGMGLNAGLVGYWTFDGPETSWATGITQDSSGQGNNGVMLGMSTTTSPTIGKIGQALNFNGTSSYINISPFPSTHSVLTVSAWVYPTALSQSSFGGGTGGSVIDENEGGGSAGWLFGIKNNGTIWFWPSGSNDKYSTGTVPLNKWTFVTATYDGTSIRFYINGALDSTQTMSTPQGSATFFKIGAESWTTGYWKGKLDDVRIYSRALSSQEVAQLYAAGR